MAIKLPNGDILRNLQEQVQKNKEDIQRHYEIERVLADWGIRIIGQLETWEIPTGSFEYGDAYAVGPDGGPFVFYIYTRGNPDYWFDYGAISIVGPAGPQGPVGVGERGERGSKWFVGSNAPTGPDIKENDIWLRVGQGGTTDGFVYIYQNGNWALATSIIGPQGIQGPEGKQGPRGQIGPQGPQGKDGNPSPIIDIIGELPEGSIISNTYDPATVPSNSGVLMPVSGVNHLFIIINGNWTDSGSWGQGGTKVYVGGEEVVEFNADNYFKKKTTGDIYSNGVVPVQKPGDSLNYQGIGAPGYESNGNFVIYQNSNLDTTMPNTIIRTGMPKYPAHCANKQYVDNAIARAHGELQHTVLEWFKGQQLQFQVDMGVYINPSMPSMPNAFQLYGIGGYVLNAGNYYSNGPSTNELSFSITDFTAKLTSYNPGSTTGSILGQFKIDDYTINGTVATFILTADDFGPEGGIFTFDCIPHSPSSI